MGIRSENGEFKKFRKLGSYTAKKDFDRLAKEWDGKERTPVSPLFQLVLFVEAVWMCIPVPVYPGRSVHSAPIDNRWNKKLEFVYSLVTQIRAAIPNHPPPPSPPFVSFPNTNAFLPLFPRPILVVDPPTTI